MKITLNFDGFERAFQRYGRGEQFSYFIGLKNMKKIVEQK